MRIGIFDSGIGGLTVLKAIRNRYRNVDIFYLGDTARVPYGNKSAQTVIRYSLECSNFLIEKDIDLLLIACNTASSYAIDRLREGLDIPIIGVVEPGVRKAIEVSRSKKIGVIGTTATIRSGIYQNMLKEMGKDSLAKPCPLFVPLVEEGLTDGEIALSVVKYYLQEFKKEDIDTLILGCTHYPLLKSTIGKFLKGVKVIDSADAVTDEISQILKDLGASVTELYFTDVSPNLEQMIERIFGKKLKVNHINTLCSL